MNYFLYFIFRQIYFIYVCIHSKILENLFRFIITLFILILFELLFLFFIDVTNQKLLSTTIGKWGGEKFIFFYFVYGGM